jgi:hypothetical protein
MTGSRFLEDLEKNGDPGKGAPASCCSRLSNATMQGLSIGCSASQGLIHPLGGSGRPDRTAGRLLAVKLQRAFRDDTAAKLESTTSSQDVVDATQCSLQLRAKGSSPELSMFQSFGCAEISSQELVLGSVCCRRAPKLQRLPEFQLRARQHHNHPTVTR